MSALERVVGHSHDRGVRPGMFQLGLEAKCRAQQRPAEREPLEYLLLVYSQLEIAIGQVDAAPAKRVADAASALPVQLTRARTAVDV